VLGLLLPGIIGLKQVQMRKQASLETEDLSQTLLPIAPVDVVFTMVLRPLFASCVGYLLYRCLLPSNHPLKLHMLSNFLSLSVFQHLGVLTYSVYIIHFRIVFEVMFGLLPPTLLDSLQGGAQRGVEHVFMYAIITYVITLCIAYFMYYFIETPLHRLGGKVVRWVEGVLGGGGVKNGQKVAPTAQVVNKKVQ
jgi:peptidoglycan/LPS O-acetylase OafA/YrhL